MQQYNSLIESTIYYNTVLYYIILNNILYYTTWCYTSVVYYIFQELAIQLNYEPVVFSAKENHRTQMSSVLFSWWNVVIFIPITIKVLSVLWS